VSHEPSPTRMETIPSAPFTYSGFGRPSFTGHRRTSTYAAMSDGAQLAVDVYLPTGHCGEEAAPERFPVVFVFTPYGRAWHHKKTGELRVHNLGLVGENVVEYCTYGYALVIADTRGHGASKGRGSPVFGKRYQKDAGEMLDWIAAQQWCDGNIGMAGCSHHGWTQLAAAAQGRPPLKAIMPSGVPLEGWTGLLFPGGIRLLSYQTGQGLSEHIRNYLRPSGDWVVAPVLDEKGDELLAGETAEESGPNDYGWKQAPFIDTAASDGETGRDILANVAGAIYASRAAFYHVGAWYDAFPRGTTELYCTHRATNPSRLIMWPGYHLMNDWFPEDYFGEVAPNFVPERLRFFDRYLKGIDTGIDREPEVLIFVINGGGWRQEREWPLAREQRKMLYLTGDHRLDASLAGEGADAFKVDLAHDRRYGPDLSSRWTALFGVPIQGLPDMTAKDAESLVYTSSSLQEDAEVTGHPIVRLWVSSTAPDGDFFIFLEDVDATGRSLLVTEGQLRAGFAGLHDPNTMTDTGVDVQPKLPWHGYEKADYRGDILAKGAVVELVIDLAPVSWVFRAGHRLRIAITGANYPDFALHPRLSPANDPSAPDNIVPTITVHRGMAHPSSIDLPVVPRTRPAGSAA